MTRHAERRSGILTANAFLSPLQLTAHFQLIFQNSFPKAGTLSIWIGSTLCQDQCCHHMVNHLCNFNVQNEKSGSYSWIILVKPDFNSFSLMTDSIYYLIPESPKFTCNCLSLLPFSSLLFQLFIPFPGSCNFSQLIMQSLNQQPQTELPSS